MSLTDIDKENDQRTRPVINASDVMGAGSIKAHAAEGGVSYRTEDLVGKPKVSIKDDQILVHDGTNNRVLIGRDTGGF